MLSSDVACCFHACMPYVSVFPLSLPLSPHLLLLYLAQESPIPDGLGPTKGYFPSKGNFSSPLLLVWRFYIFSWTTVWMEPRSFTCLSDYWIGSPPTPRRFTASRLPARHKSRKKLHKRHFTPTPTHPMLTSPKWAFCITTLVSLFLPVSSHSPRLIISSSNGRGRQ